ncbi:unnamed protein product [Camellia sinensis]
MVIPGQEHVDIITFYNKIFVAAVKPLLAELAPVGTAQKNQNSETNNGTDGMTVFSIVPRTEARVQPLCPNEIKCEDVHNGVGVGVGVGVSPDCVNGICKYEIDQSKPSVGERRKPKHKDIVTEIGTACVLSGVASSYV